MTFTFLQNEGNLSNLMMGLRKFNKEKLSEIFAFKFCAETFFENIEFVLRQAFT